MNDPDFFPRAAELSLDEVAALAGVEPPAGRTATVRAVASLDEAGPGDLAYMDDPRDVAALERTRAGICVVGPRFASRVPAHSIGLVVADPQLVYADVLARLHPSSLRPASLFGGRGIAPGATIHPTARLEPDVTIDPGAIVGPDVEIGAGSLIGAGSAIGPGVRIGRQCSIGPGACVLNAFLGNRVIVHSGVRIGQDGFAFALGPRHAKIPQVGRVIVQDDVEIGANSTIDRGGTRDTVIGEGTKVDNLVQIAHDVAIGRHCVIVAQTGIAGSVTLEDHVIIGGQVGVVGHIVIGEGSQIAASSNVATNVPSGSRWGGTPAKPMRQWFREIASVKGLASRRHPAKDGGNDDP